ncbi:MAG: ABC transporter substrate-binding protein [Acidimicrobiales bacterium]
MFELSRLGQTLAVVGIGVLVVASTTVAGASSLTGTYNKTDAALVPSSFKNTTLQVATDATYAPDEYMSGTTMEGFDVDLIHAVATTLDIKVNENNVTFDSILGGIEGGRYAIGNSSFTDTVAREKQVYFVDYFQAGEGVYAKKGEKVTFRGLPSFCGLKVAVETGTTEQSDAVTEKAKCPSGKALSILAFPTQTEANLAVLSGQANVGFVDSQIATNIVATSKGKFESVGNAIEVAPYGIATPKTSAGKGLARAIQAAVKTLIANGAYTAILNKYGVTAGALPASKVVIDGAAG